VGLRDLANDSMRLHWALQLSQRSSSGSLSARALVQKPDWLFLDEATSRLTKIQKRGFIDWYGENGLRERRYSVWAIAATAASLPFSPKTRGAGEW